MEDGQKVEVKLERIDELPLTYGDELLGLWELENGVGADRMFTLKGRDKGYLFFRWDGRYVIGSLKGRSYGVYNVHGHKPEVEFIPYGEDMERSFWEFQLTDTEINMHLLNSDSTVTRTFKRIHVFPQ